MAFTDAEESTLKKVVVAFDNAKKISQLEPGTGSVKDSTIEVIQNGESRQMSLSEAVVTAQNGYCGRYFDETNSTPKAAGYCGSLDMLRNLPSLLGLGCYLVQDDRSRRKLDPTNHYRFEDGSPAKLDGSMGQYMWCWNAHYFTTWMEGTRTYYAISFTPIAGKKSYRIPSGGTSALGGGVIDRTNNILCSVINSDPQFRGGGNQAAWDDTYKSQLGMPATAYRYGGYSELARKRGEGWEANWYVAQAVTEYLFMIIMGTKNCQESFNPTKDENGLFQGGLGSGVTVFSGWGDYNGYYPVVPCSAGVELGDSCGEASFNVLGADGNVYASVKIPVFFGLKNLFGHTWSVVSGIVTNVGVEKTEHFVAPSLYAGWSQTDTSALLKAAESPRTEGWIKKKSFNLLCRMPTEVGASLSTYYCDYFWHNPSSQGLRACLSSSRAGGGTNAGAFCTYSYDALSDSYTTVSSPLCFFNEDPIMTN